MTVCRGIDFLDVSRIHRVHVAPPHRAGFGRDCYTHGVIRDSEAQGVGILTANVTAIDPKSGNALWSDQKLWAISTPN